MRKCAQSQRLMEQEFCIPQNYPNLTVHATLVRYTFCRTSPAGRGENCEAGKQTPTL